MYVNLIRPEMTNETQPIGRADSTGATVEKCRNTWDFKLSFGLRGNSLNGKVEGRRGRLNLA